jgi:hypothetical protein
MNSYFKLEPTIEPRRTSYVPPKLEVLPKFNAVIGCSVAGGCLPINSSLVTKIIEGRS